MAGNDVSNRRFLDQLTSAAMADSSVPTPAPLAPAVASEQAPPADQALATGVQPPVTDPSTKNLESIAASPETLAGNVDATAASGKRDDPEQPNFLHKLGRIAGGLTGLSDPNSSPEAKLGSKIGALAGRVGGGLAAAEGTPEQQRNATEMAQMPLKLASIQNEAGYRSGMLKLGQQNADTKVDVAATAQQKADQQQQAAEAKMRLRGYMPDEKNPGAFRPYTPDEVLADKNFSMNRELTQAAIDSKNAAAELALARADALKDPDNPTFKLKEKEIDKKYAFTQANFDIKLHAQNRADQEHLFNYGQAAPGSAQAGDAATGAPAAEGGPIPAQPGGLSLSNAPDSMLVNPTTGQVIPNKLLSTLKPTMDEQKRADFATSAIHSVDRIQQLVDQAKAKVGPFSGRTAELMAKAGFGDQFNQELQNYVRFSQAAATAAHTGRFSVPILEKMDKMIGPEMNPDQLTGAIASIKDVMAKYADQGWKPTVAEYNQFLNGLGKTPSGKTAPKTPNAAAPPRSNGNSANPGGGGPQNGSSVDPAVLNSITYQGQHPIDVADSPDGRRMVKMKQGGPWIPFSGKTR